jgi:hypothetical protein
VPPNDDTEVTETRLRVVGAPRTVGIGAPRLGAPVERVGAGIPRAGAGIFRAGTGGLVAIGRPLISILARGGAGSMGMTRVFFGDIGVSIPGRPGNDGGFRLGITGGPSREAGWFDLIVKPV